MLGDMKGHHLKNIKISARYHIQARMIFKLHSHFIISRFSILVQTSGHAFASVGEIDDRNEHITVT